MNRMSSLCPRAERISPPASGGPRRAAFALAGGLAAILGSAFAGAPVAAQQDWESVEIRVNHVAGNVYMLEGRGGNIGVSVGSDGALIVDDQFAPLADRIRSALAEILPSGTRLEFVLNTHYHGDHTGGNPEFGPEAPIIAHANVRRRLSLPRGENPPMAEEGLPIITFGDSLSIHFNGEEIRAIHFPHGHTDGDAVIFFTGSNVVHMGDDLFADRFPFVDLDAGGSVQGLATAIGMVLGQIPSDAKVIPGHGPLSEVEGLRRYKRMLEESMEIVAERMSDGQSLEEVKAAGLPEAWAEWGSGFISTERWLETVYQSLARERG